MKFLGEHIPYERRRFIHSLIIPLLFLLICWLVKLWEVVMDVSFGDMGVLPRTLEGLRGILLMPFIHGNVNHLTANSMSFIVLGVSLFYFYRDIALKVLLIILIGSGTILWIIGRQYYHIGASGIIYGFGSFLLVSGIIRRHINLVALSFFVVFSYGSMFWYMFPIYNNDPISWEGHLSGAIVGLILAVYYRNIGLKKEEWHWEDEEESEVDYMSDNVDENKENEKNNEI